MQTLLVSIIIPIYKVEPYIVRCIDSVLHQTYRNLEVILVDDCTPDCSMELAKHCIEQSPLSGDLSFIHLKHDHNRGLSAARNTGIDAATGEYVYFLDSDDEILPNCIFSLVNAINVDNGVEMVVGGFKQVGGTYKWPEFYLPCIHTKDIIELACSNRIYVMAWNKLIKTDFLVKNHLYFMEGLYHEDVLWSFQLACKLHSMKFIPYDTYIYWIRSNSIQSITSYKFHYINYIKVKLEMIKFVFANGLSQNQIIYNFITSDLFDYLYEARSRKEFMASRYFYKKWRESPYWSLRFIFKNTPRKIERLRSLNRILPIAVGIPYICFLKKLEDLWKKLYQKYNH